MTTCLDIILAAFAGSIFNDEELRHDPTLIEVIERRLHFYYSLASEKAPTYFAEDSAEVDGDGTGYDWPNSVNGKEALAVMRAEIFFPGTGSPHAVGDRVEIVPFEDPDAAFAPRIYQYGRAFIPFEDEVDPTPATGDSLLFSMAVQHKDLDPLLAADDAANTLEESWPEDWNELLIQSVREHVSRKDHRLEEAELAKVAEEETRQGFLIHLKLADRGVVRRHIRPES